MTNLTNVARLALRCGRVCYGAVFAGSGSALLGAVRFFTVWLALWHGEVCSCWPRYDAARRGKARLALWSGSVELG